MYIYIEREREIEARGSGRAMSEAFPPSNRYASGSLTKTRKTKNVTNNLQQLLTNIDNSVCTRVYIYIYIYIHT